MKTAFCLATLVASASAFAPAPSAGSVSALRAADVETFAPTGAEESVEPPAPPPLGPTLNGWTPDASKPCFGLPGALAPLGYFDPLGLCKDRDLVGVKRFREAEIMHGRVAMMATVGYLIGENTPTIAYGFDHPTIASRLGISPEAARQRYHRALARLRILYRAHNSDSL